MKKLILMAAVCWFGVQVHADAWLTDLPKALAQAKAEKKFVLMDFTGSDWCPPCIKLHKEILDTPEFTAFAQTNLVLVLVDFPFKKPQAEQLATANNALKDKYQVDGFPTVIILDGDGNVVDKQQNFLGLKPKEFIANVKKVEQQKKP